MHISHFGFKMSSPPNPLDLDNATAIIHKVMQCKQLNSRDVDPKRGKIDAFGLGHFTCLNDLCERGSWASRYSWATIDLWDLRLVKRWKMKCKECAMQWEASFDKDQLSIMVERAVCEYKGERYESVRSHSSVYHGGPRKNPHIPELCEKCEWGRTICWRGRAI